MPITNTKRILWPVGTGITGALFMTLIYLSIVSLVNDFQFAITLFGEDQQTTLPLIFGFGVQVALYTILKKQLFIPIINAGPSGALTGAGGTTSTVAMVACCAHRVVDVLPILGLTAAATFLAEYQTLFRWVGLSTSLLGIAVMLFILFRERNKVLQANPDLLEPGMVGHSTTPLFITLGIFVFLYAGTAIGFELFSSTDQPVAQTEIQTVAQPEPEPEAKTEYPIVLEAASNNPTGWADLPTQTDGQGAVTVEVTPLNLNNPSDQLSLGVVLNTHSVDLSIDLAANSSLTTDTGLSLIGSLWDAPSGGHHVSGVLLFTLSATDLELLTEATQLTLTIQNVDAVERIFTWEK